MFGSCCVSTRVFVRVCSMWPSPTSPPPLPTSCFCLLPSCFLLSAWMSRGSLRLCDAGYSRSSWGSSERFPASWGVTWRTPLYTRLAHLRWSRCCFPVQGMRYRNASHHDSSRQRAGANSLMDESEENSHDVLMVFRLYNSVLCLGESCHLVKVIFSMSKYCKP